MQRRRFLGLTAAVMTTGSLCAPGDLRARPAAFTSSRITVETRGSGPDVILIPGLASTPAIWARLAERLERRRRLHLVAVRGFGALAAEANAEGPLSAPVAAEIARYVRETRLTRPALIGHSLGGQVALRVAAALPAVGRVMTVDASPYFPGLVRPGATTAEIEPVARLAFQAVRLLGDDALQGRGRALGLELGGAADAVFQTVGWQGGDRRVLAQGVYEVMTADLRERLTEVSGPVTVVYGAGVGRDSPRRQLGARLRTAYARLRHPARFEAIAGAEHMVMIDRPTAFAEAVDRFLA